MPQFVLGAAFSWAIPMAYVAQGKVPDLSCWLLYAANLSWTVAYDTQYAMTDRPDDLKIGVKSTAILFGKYDLAVIFVLQLLSLGLLAWVFYLNDILLIGSAGLLIALGLFCYQLYKTLDRQPTNTFWAFRHNRWIGLIIWLAIIVAYFIVNL